MSDENEEKGFSKEMKYDLTEFIATLPLQEAQRRGITKLVSTMLKTSEAKMEKKIKVLIDKRVEKFWKIISGVIIGVVAGLILYMLPAK